ncbi:transmembrane and death domain protein 1-like [Lampris incognitus]|uniref:transmembrane and death domain protein 1-like n=1 Tax=Lampris incognitus TaxID=2546036 RepID=UPI0024B53A1A|nr:transmembrane and death domain protein 1-like [Lampris incognitus]
MRAVEFIVFTTPLLLTSTVGEDTVAEDIGSHQVERLVELLTSKECENLLGALSHLEEDIFQHLQRLSPENNQLDLKSRVRRDTSFAADRESQCRMALTDWLLKNGEQIYYDRLARALQHIGRTDIAVEVGKNINQDKTLSLKRYVEDYHKHGSNYKIPSAQTEKENHRFVRQKAQRRKVRDLTWSDLDLIIERMPVPQKHGGLLHRAWPLLYGLLLGFGGTSLMGVFILLLIIRLAQRNQLSGHPSATGGSFVRHHSRSSQKSVAADGLCRGAACGRPAGRSRVA